MSNLVLLLLCFGLGIALRASGRLPDNAHSTLNALVVNIALPALILLHLRTIPLDGSLIRAVGMAWLIFALAIVFFLSLARSLRTSRETAGGLILTAGLANTSFVGVPMIEAFYGSHGIALGLAIDQLGSYLILATLGIVIATCCSATRFDPTVCLKKIVTFPPLLAVVAALAMRSVPFPEWSVALLSRLGDLVAPVALLSVGCQLRFSALAGNRTSLCAGLVFKLMLAPLVITLVLASSLQPLTEPSRIAAFEMAMPPMIGAAIIAAEHRLNPPLVSLMVGIGIPLSFVTLPLWWFVLSRF